MDQIGYTSAPDIIHEAAGHAPIIANPAYAAYLKRFGEIGAKAFSSGSDYRMYEAIRHLSILKADPYTEKDLIAEAESAIEYLENHLGEPSELAQIRNLHWWTVEYGLIGTIENPKIYGAGLLSSIAESYYCMTPKVKKILYTLEAVKYSFDITEPQPQLFVTPDFETLSRVLDEFANTMGVRKGGLEGIKKAIRSETTATCVFSSGLQVSGTFTEVLDKKGEPVFLRTTGPSNLNFAGKEIAGQDKGYHQHGFSSPVGKFKKLSVPPEDATDDELKKLGFNEQEKVEFEYESGLKLSGILVEKIRKQGKLILLQLTECEVVYEGKQLYKPSWGMYDMAVGAKILSCYSGPADPEAFGLTYRAPEEKTHKLEHTEKARQLFELYQQVRNNREKKEPLRNLEAIWNNLKTNHPDDWLCALEILELFNTHNNDPVYIEIKKFLDAKKYESDYMKKLIEDGYAMLS
jgi:phenylalanine-4-hydroxylase